MKMKILFPLIMVLLVFIGCNSSKPKPQPESENQLIKLHKAIVQEVIQTTKYTYLHAAEGQKVYWAAISKQDIAVGDQFFYMDDAVTQMVNFHSPELNRDFPAILFISQITSGNEKKSASPHGETMSQPAVMPQSAMKAEGHTGRKTVPAAENISVNPVSGGLTIAQLYADKAKYAGKKVKIRGSVVKVNNQIMGRNWVHLQDGTKHDGEYDLTCTTQLMVAVGDVITMEGVIGLNRDFTSGYFYPVIMEEAVVVK
jgi:uncharacterized protein YcfL